MAVTFSSSSTGTSPNSSISGAIQRMQLSGDPKAQAMAMSLMNNYGVSGSGAQSTSNLSLKDQALKAAGTVANFAAPVLNILNRPDQAVLHLAQGIAPNGGVSMPQALQNAGESLTGQAPQINLRQAILGNDQGSNNLGMDQGGLLAGAIDTVGESALDPLNLLGGPLRKLAGSATSAGVDALQSTDRGAAAIAKLQSATQPIRNAVIPGAREAAALGPETGATVHSGIQSSLEDASQRTGDINNQLQSLIKASGTTDDEIKNVINPALETGTASTLAQSFAGQGNQLKADLVKQLQGLLPKATTDSFMPEAHMARNIPLELNKVGQKLYDKNPEPIANALGVTTKALNDAVGSRDLSKLGGLSLNDIDSKLSEAGLVGTGKQAVNHDIVNLAVKSAQRQAEAQSTGKLLTDTFKNVADNEGRKIVLPAANQAEADARGFVSRELQDGSKVFVHPVVNRAMHDISSVINNDKSLDTFDKTIKKINRLWKGYQVLTPHFHSQNVFGNVFMNMVAGLRNPKYYADAQRLQRIMSKLGKSTDGFEAALTGAKISDNDGALIQQIRSQHIADSSFSHAILSNPRKLTGESKGILGKAKGVLSKANPIDENNVALTGNRKLGSALENNSRIAHFIWKLDKTGSATEARASVAKHLFDYNDLTPIERKRLQAVIPFYTYMRKNTPAQLRLMMEHPAFYSHQASLTNNLQQHGPDNGTQYDPNKLANGAVPIQLPGMSSPVLLNPSNPLYSAFGQLQPLGDAAALVPGTSLSRTVQSPAANLAQNVLAPMGGVPVGLAKYAAEEATGKNLFTGGNIQPGTNLSLLGSSVVPLFSQNAGTLKAIKTGNDAKLLNNLAGLPVSQGGANATDATLNARLNAVQAALATLQGQRGKGAVPTLSALRKSGKAPRAARVRKPRAKTAKRSHHKKTA